MRSLERKGQVSVEFMFIFILFMAVLALAVVFVMQSSQGIYLSSMEMGSEEMLSKVKGGLDSAFLEGDGFSTNLTLPSQIMGADYSISISSGFALIDINNQTYSKILLARNITGSLRKGENMLKNVNQGIVIS
jgi:hypothetical protein